MLPFGSSVTGCASKGADVDAALLFRNSAPKPKKFLRKILRLAKTARGMKGMSAQFIPAKVPLLKVVKDEIDLDLTCNNIVPLFNSFLLRNYCELMPEIVVLSMAVKYWAKNQMIGSVHDGALSSYAWTLMLELN